MFFQNNGKNRKNKQPLWQGFDKNKGKHREKTPFLVGLLLDGIGAKIEKTPFLGEVDIELRQE